MDSLALPLHQRISNHLKQQIEAHLLKPGEKLPSEKELCAQFSVSRITVRKSLSELTATGLIHSVPGKGTFVSKPPLKPPLSPLSSFSMEMERRGFQLTSRVLVFRLIKANLAIAEKFRVSPGTEIIQLERIRMILPEKTPAAIQKVMLLHSRIPGILSLDLASHSLYDILQSHYDLALDRSETVVTARMSTPRENRLLGMQQSSAVLHYSHTTFLTSGEIIEVSDSVFRPDLYRFEVVVEGGSATFH